MAIPGLQKATLVNLLITHRTFFMAMTNEIECGPNPHRKADDVLRQPKISDRVQGQNGWNSVANIAMFSELMDSGNHMDVCFAVTDYLHRILGRQWHLEETQDAIPAQEAATIQSLELLQLKKSPVGQTYV